MAVELGFVSHPASPGLSRSTSPTRAAPQADPRRSRLQVHRGLSVRTDGKPLDSLYVPRLVPRTMSKSECTSPRRNSARSANADASQRGSGMRGRTCPPRLDAALNARLLKIINDQRTKPVVTRRTEQLPDGRTRCVTIILYPRRLQSLPCVACRTLASNKACRFHYCGECCRQANRMCKVHRTAAWAESQAAERRMEEHRHRAQRGPCAAFRAGSCDRGDDCPYEHSVDANASVPQVIAPVSSPISVLLQCQSSGRAGRPEIAVGDKVLLPPSILALALQRDLSYPLVRAAGCVRCPRAVSADEPVSCVRPLHPPRRRSAWNRSVQVRRRKQRRCRTPRPASTLNTWAC